MTSQSKSKVPNVRCALSLSCPTDLLDSINVALEQKYTYIITPLIHPRFKREHVRNNNMPHHNLPLTRSDLLLSGDCWQNYVIGVASRFYNCDSNNYIVQKNAEKGLIEELKFTSHLNLSAFIIPIRNTKVENFSRIINSFLLNKLILYNILVSIPIQSVNRDDVISNENIEDLTDESWNTWTKIRTFCEENTRLGLILELTADLPSKSKLDRWFSEPVKAIIIPTSLFLTNRSGFPVLPKSHQQVLLKFFQLDIDIIVQGANRNERGSGKYYEYLNHLFKNQETGDGTKKFTKGYEDSLQNPLQPLMDNLESQIYEIFEKDPCKYISYKNAIKKALLDRVPDNEKLSKESTIMVLGAGRGPLVKCALEAAAETQRKCKIFALEKNLNAINTLLNLKKDLWGDSVTVIASDMREWAAPNKADIIVSELLGSFGCNELSPECLYGAQSLLKDDGISIPSKYTSYIAPVQSYKIYSEIKRCREYENPFEAAYVVLLHNHYRIDQPKDLFEFHHPTLNALDLKDTSRYKSVTFTAEEDATIHGIAGYFDCVLYKDITLSITPGTHSPGLFSWFPMFFPIINPIPVKSQEKITVHFWRKLSNKQAWYEWCLSEPICSKIHNPNGRTYWIGL